MIVQDLAESTWEPINDGRFNNPFPPDIKKLIRQNERINKNTYTKNVYYV